MQQLEFFRAVARNLSFSAAAKELYTSQPYVSNQIRRLEEHFAVPLFIRSAPKIALTEAGAALYDRVGAILENIAELDQVAEQFQGLRRGTIELAASVSPGNHVLPELIAAFQRRHPELMVRMRIGNTAEILRRLERDEAEVGINPQRPETGGITAEPFYAEPLIVIHTDPDLPDPMPVARFATLPKVIREPGSLTLAEMNTLLADHGVADAGAVVAQLDGTTAVNEAVAAGLGASLVPERSARAWLESGAVRASRLADADPAHEYFVLYPRQRYVTPAANALIRFLRDVAPSETSGDQPR